MKNLLKSKIIKNILKILSIKSEKDLIGLKKKTYDKWDSLTHLNIIFILEKNLKKKVLINKLNKIKTGKDIIKIINDNQR